MLFSAPENKIYTDEGLSVTYFMRPVNDYDTLATNIEWAFMDDLEWSDEKLRKRFPRQLFSIRFFSYKLRLLLSKKG